MANAKPRDVKGQAAELLEDAFWELLEEVPYSKISVLEVARRAGVNRNAFYYHFSNLDELAAAAVRKRVPFSQVLEAFAHVDAAEPVPKSLSVAPENEWSLKLSRLLVGPHSTMALVRVASETAIDTWLGAYGLERDDLDDTELMGLEFTIGGIVGLLGAPGLMERFDHPIQALWDSPYTAMSIRQIGEIAAHATARKTAATR